MKLLLPINLLDIILNIRSLIDRKINNMYIIDTSQETFLKKSCSCHVVVDGAVVYLVLDNTK